MVVLAELFVVSPSLVAEVVTVTLLLPDVVGEPDTVQVIDAPIARFVGGTGEQEAVKPAGKPLIEQVAEVALEPPELVQV